MNASEKGIPLNMSHDLNELYGQAIFEQDVEWQRVVEHQMCPFLHRTCLKTRKSAPEQTIGTCTVTYGKTAQPIVICPHRLLERKQIFTDCLHLLTTHEPGNELHIVPEVRIPGGNVDYFLVSVHEQKVKDFVGIELQTIDTTGTVWPFRQRFLHAKGVEVEEGSIESKKSFGMNWKMTAKTILVQLHHKIETFEHINKHLVLVIQDCLLEYMRGAFSFEHITDARVGDSMHFHAYTLTQQDDRKKLSLQTRQSPDAEGIAICLGLQIPANVELAELIAQLEAKISDETMFTIIQEG
jgi:hypothetical protein